MTDIVLVGVGGCMKELLWQFKEYNEYKPTWNIKGYINPVEDFDVENLGNYPYLGTDEDLLKVTEPTNVVICIAEPRTRKKLVELYRSNPNIQFPAVILSKDGIAPDAMFGEGCLISKDCIVSSNVILGNFVFMNMRSMVCHDGRVGEFTTLAPYAKIAGTVRIGSHCELGMGCSVIQGLNIGDSVKVGAGAVVVRDIPSCVTAVGVPAVVKKRI